MSSDHNGNKLEMSNRIGNRKICKHLNVKQHKSKLMGEKRSFKGNQNYIEMNKN